MKTENPTIKFWNMKRDLEVNMYEGGILASPEVVAGKALASTLAIFGDWPDAANHGKFFATLQESMDAEMATA